MFSGRSSGGVRSEATAIAAGTDRGRGRSGDLRWVWEASETPAGPSRKGSPDERSRSVAVHRLQQNLIVAAANGSSIHEAIAGGWCLAALKAQKPEGKLPGESGRDRACGRHRLPANESGRPVEALATLVDVGKTASTIAASTGMSEQGVRQGVKRGKVTSRLLAAA